MAEGYGRNSFGKTLLFLYGKHFFSPMHLSSTTAENIIEIKSFHKKPGPLDYR